MGLVIYKGTLLKSIEWESDRKKSKFIYLLTAKIWDEKKTFFSKHFFFEKNILSEVGLVKIWKQSDQYNHPNERAS